MLHIATAKMVMTLALTTPQHTQKHNAHICDKRKPREHTGRLASWYARDVTVVSTRSPQDIGVSSKPDGMHQHDGSYWDRLTGLSMASKAGGAGREENKQGCHNTKCAEPSAPGRVRQGGQVNLRVRSSEGSEVGQHSAVNTPTRANTS